MNVSVKFFPSDLDQKFEGNHMTITHRTSNETATMSLTGKFVFNSHREFRDGYESLLKTPGIKTLEIDLGGVDYIDSAALGMLLLLRERAAVYKIDLRLTRCHGTVREILDVANFGRIFAIT